MKIKTSELKGAALDWAVAKCEGVPVDQGGWDNRFIDAYQYSSDWSQGGPIIEREKIDVYHLCPGSWRAEDLGNWYNGPTPLIAAMRCYVASKLGDEVEVPEELT